MASHSALPQSRSGSPGVDRLTNRSLEFASMRSLFILAVHLLAGLALGQNGPATNPPGHLAGSSGDGTFSIIYQAPVPAPGPCPYPWTSGLAAFADPLNPADPNDDREYLALGRNNGVMVVDVTAPRVAVPANVHLQSLTPPTPIFVAEAPIPVSNPALQAA